MWQLFTESARRVVFFAQEEAGRLGQHLVSTEHLLLGLLRMPDSFGMRILQTLDVDLAKLRAELRRNTPRGRGSLVREMELTAGGKQVINLALDEAKRLGQDYIGTEHLLIGMVREPQGLAGRTLHALGVTVESLRTAHSHVKAPSGDVWPPPIRQQAGLPETLPAQKTAAENSLKKTVMGLRNLLRPK